MLYNNVQWTLSEANILLIVHIILLLVNRLKYTDIEAG